ncbi:MAG: glycosyltransferase family 2 protein [Ardenticatenia bacterium]|nr:MAG: glycosyltransferase family 2 protein [Ardenticatenia bacterium]
MEEMAMNANRVSVIVPLWNGAACIGDCLKHLAAQTIAEQIEILVVDDASPDDGAALVETSFPHVRLLRRPVNGGFAAACNTGLQAASGDVLVLLNQDVLLAPDAIERLVAALDVSERGVVGGKLRYPDGSLQHAGGYLLWPKAFGMHDGVGEPDEGQYDTPREVEFLTGALLAVRRDVFERVGGLDEGFYPAYYEDVDWCFRIRAAGYRVWYAPDVAGTHQEGSVLRRASHREIAYHRGRWRFLLKHMPPARLLAETIPAEMADVQLWQNQHTPYALQQAWLAAMVQAATLLRRQWQADEQTIFDVVRALQILANQTWQAEQSFRFMLPQEPPRLVLPRPEWSPSRWKRLRQRLRWWIYTRLWRYEHEQLISQQNAINAELQQAVKWMQVELASVRQALSWLAHDIAYSAQGEEESHE